MLRGCTANISASYKLSALGEMIVVYEKSFCASDGCLLWIISSFLIDALVLCDLFFLAAFLAMKILKLESLVGMNSKYVR